MPQLEYVNRLLCPPREDPQRASSTESKLDKSTEQRYFTYMCSSITDYHLNNLSFKSVYLESLMQTYFDSSRYIIRKFFLDLCCNGNSGIKECIRMHCTMFFLTELWNKKLLSRKCYQRFRKREKKSSI